MENNPVDIVLCNHKFSLNQSYSTGLMMSFVNEKHEQINQFFFCKDYFQDIIRSHLHDITCHVYGFQYDPSQMLRPDMNATRLLIKHKIDNFDQKVNNSIKFVNWFASKMKILKSNKVEIKNLGKDHAYVVGSKIWMSAPPLISLYTLLLRAGIHYNPDISVEDTINLIKQGKFKCENNDASMLRVIMPLVEKIIKHGYRKFFYIDPKKNFPEEVDILKLHNNGGINSLASGYSIVEYSTKKLQKFN